MPQAQFDATGPLLSTPSITEKRATLPALRQSGPRPPVGSGESISDGLNALLAKPGDRSERAKELLARQPMMASHPIVAGLAAEFTPHRPPRPEKSEGGIAFKVVSEYEPKGDQPTAIEELVAGVEAHEKTRCCSASPARARPSRWRR